MSFSNSWATYVGFEPLPGTTSTLSEADGQTLCIIQPGTTGIELLDSQSGAVFNPDSYKLTMKDGTVLIINQNTGLTYMKDSNGNELFAGEYGITNQKGASISINRDPLTKLVTSITDSNNNTAVQNSATYTTCCLWRFRLQLTQGRSHTGSSSMR